MTHFLNYIEKLSTVCLRDEILSTTSPASLATLSPDADITLFAEWTPAGNGGNGGSGGSGGGTVVEKPAVSGNTNPPVTVSDNTVKTPAKGDTITVKAGDGSKLNGTFTVTNPEKKEVSYTLPEGANAKNITVPDTVTSEDGTVYKVTEIVAGDLSGTGKLKKLTVGINIKKVDPNAFKGIEVSKKTKIIIKAKNNKEYKKLVKQFKKAGAKKATFKFKKIKTKKNKK